MKRIFEKHISCTSTHGLPYIGKTNFHWIERVMWLVIIGIFIYLGYGVASTLWYIFKNSEILIEVNDTLYGIDKVPFPSVTICPKSPVKRKEGLAFLSRFVNSSNETEHKVMEKVLDVLTRIHYPSFELMEPNLEETKDYHHKFIELNTTDFMIHAMPRCNEVLDKCYWLGVEMDCCKLFKLQRTESGFCYAFNSLTSESLKHCDVLKVLKMKPNKDTLEQNECVLKHVSSSDGSGLRVTLKPKIDAYNELTEMNPVMVVTSAPYEYPQVDSGYPIWTQHGNLLKIEVIPLITISTDEVYELPQETRLCLYNKERFLTICNFYSMASCLIQCRHNYIIERCKCRLYFYDDKTFPVCRLHQLSCVARIAYAMRSFKPPNIGIYEEDYEDSPSCHCYPLCTTTTYDFLVVRTHNPMKNANKTFGTIEMYFSVQGAVRYHRELAFDFTNLLDCFGGVASLFLGCSIISVMEVIYLVIKGFYEFYVKKRSNRIIGYNVRRVYID